MNTFVTAYLEYRHNVLEPTYDHLKAFFATWRDNKQYWARYHNENGHGFTQSPVHRVKVHIKEPTSVVDKIRRSPKYRSSGLSVESVEHMTDAVRARVIVYFLSQLPMVHRELMTLAQKGIIEISTEDRPRAFLSQETMTRLSLGNDFERIDKHSGYTSLHYIMRFTDTPVPCPWLELQVRTATEDVWGEIEHVLGYKPDRRTSLAVKHQFWILSKLLGAIDEHFNFLYDELRKFQDRAEFEDDQPLNPENVPPLLAQFGIGCPQGDVNGILKALFSLDVKTIGDLRPTLATPGRVERIKNAFVRIAGRQGTAHEILGTLAGIRNSTTSSQEDFLIESLVSYYDKIHLLRREFTQD